MVTFRKYLNQSRARLPVVVCPVFIDEQTVLIHLNPCDPLQLIKRKSFNATIHLNKVFGI